MAMSPSGESSSEDQTEKIVSAFIDHHRYSTLGSLVKGIIHNLNGSLQVLSMHMELLQRMLQGNGDPLDPKIHAKTEQCLRQVDKLKGIIEGLALKAKHDEQDAPQPIHANDLLEECLSLLHHHLFFKHQVQVKKDFSSDLPLLQGAYIDFHIGLLNLIYNAIEAMEETTRRELTLITRPLDQSLQILIADTGCGIDEKTRPFLFTPFFTTKGGKHNGLGLFISKALLAPYGASFDCLSGPGETSFSVTFPIQPVSMRHQ
jgi:signal transduction histidine kinase